MNVKELKEQLEKYPDDYEIALNTDGHECTICADSATCLYMDWYEDIEWHIDDYTGKELEEDYSFQRAKSKNHLRKCVLISGS